MSAGFSLKKIKTKQTLGMKFKRMRSRLKVSLLDAELETKIRSKYLEYLEESDWKSLPADAYTKGFVIRYAKFLGMDANKALAEYKDEKSIFINRSSDLILPQKTAKDFGYIITPKILIPIVSAIFVLFIFGYILFQVYGFAAAPQLQVASPDNNSVVETDNIEVRGVTDQAANIYINSEKVSVSSEGKFAADIKLNKGVNIIEIKSENKAQKEKVLTYTVEYKPKTAENTAINNTN